MVRQLTEGLSFEQRAYALAEALSWLQCHHNKIVVVKYGGNTMTNLKLEKAFTQDMVSLRIVSVRLVVVRGSDPQIPSMLKRLGLEGEFQGGFRVTTPETMGIVRMVLFRQAGRELMSLINAYDPYAMGIPGEDGGLFAGTRHTVNVSGKEADTGLVGNTIEVHSETLLDPIDAGRAPVVSTIMPPTNGKEAYDTNADTVAGALASAIDANRLVTPTDAKDLYTGQPNRDSLVSEISTSHLRGILPTLDSEMIPKMESYLDAVDQRVPAIHVTNGRQPHSVLLELMTSGGIGTMVKPG